MTSAPEPVTAPHSSGRFSETVRELRLRARLTQEALAELAGLSCRSVRDIERGRITHPRPETVRLLVNALGVVGEEARRLERVARSPYWQARQMTPAVVTRATTAMDTTEGVDDRTSARAERQPRHPVPAQVPAPVPYLVGRDRQLAQLDVLLLAANGPPWAPVALLTGGPGVGKSAVAAVWSHRARDAFPDGQLYLDLRGWSVEPPLDALTALGWLLRALGVPADATPSDVAVASALYRSRLAERRVLVVLDNARTADQVRPLLPGQGRCAALVTSRATLDGLAARNGARRVLLGGLDDASALQLLACTLSAEAVAREREACRDLVRLCSSLPLALRIAAAKLDRRPDASVAAYVQRLRAARLAELSVVDDDETAVSAVFWQSYRALSAPERGLFRLLGALPCVTITVPAAAALVDCDQSTATRLLDGLAQAHLVVPVADAFMMHDLLWVYAGEVCAQESTSAERQEALHRLYSERLRMTRRLAARAYPDAVTTSDPEPRPLDAGDRHRARRALEMEATDLAAVAVAAARDGHPAGWQLVDVLRPYVLSGPVEDWLEPVVLAPAAARSAGDRRGEAAARFTSGLVAVRRDQVAEAIEQLDRAAAIADAEDWPAEAAAIRRSLGNAHRLRGDHATAEELLHRSLSAARRLGLRSVEGSALYGLGLVAHERGDTAAAVQLYGEALHRCPVPDDPVRIGLLTDLADAFRALGRLDDARSALLSVLRVVRAQAFREREAYIRRCLAEVQRDSGRYVEALRQAHSARLLARELHDVRIEAQALITIGTIHQVRGNDVQARRSHRQAQRLARQAGCRYTLAEALLGHAEADARIGDLASARSHAESALAVAARAGLHQLRAQAARVLAELSTARRDTTAG